MTDTQKEPFLKCFPNKSCRIQWHGRIVHSWSHLPAKQRNKVFRGDYDLDIRKCHATIFFFLLYTYIWDLDEAREVNIQHEIDQAVETGYQADCVKELINAAVHGGGKIFARIKKQYKNDHLPDPPILERIRNWRRTLFKYHWVENPFGEMVRFRNPDDDSNYVSNKKVWEKVLCQWEGYLKIRLFHNLNPNRCHIVYDSYDGCIIKVLDTRVENLIRDEIDQRCEVLKKELGINVGYKMKKIL